MRHSECIAPCPRPLRRLLLALHLGCSIGWIGAVCAYLALAFAVPPARDPEVVRAAWIGMELVGWCAVVPLAASSLLTGLVLGAVTKWGLLRHYWVVISLVGTAPLTAVLAFHMPDVSAQADMARAADDEHLLAMGTDIAHALIGLVLLLAILLLTRSAPYSTWVHVLPRSVEWKTASVVSAYRSLVNGQESCRLPVDRPRFAPRLTSIGAGPDNAFGVDARQRPLGRCRGRSRPVPTPVNAIVSCYRSATRVVSSEAPMWNGPKWDAVTWSPGGRSGVSSIDQP